MSSIGRITGANISGINQSSTTSSGRNVGSKELNFKENFVFPEIVLKERSNGQVAVEDRPNREVLIQLFSNALENKINIVPRNPRDHGDYIVEASFVAAVAKSSPAMLLLPLRGVKQPLIAPHNMLLSTEFKEKIVSYVDTIINASTDNDILRLLIVTAHEFGHFLSFVRGNHDEELKIGMSLFKSKHLGDNFNYTWQVFREESMAWRFGGEKLKHYGFDDFDTYTQVKNSSLKTYFQALDLVNAPLEVYYKLSLLGDDFYNNNTSNYFELEEMAN